MKNSIKNHARQKQLGIRAVTRLAGVSGFTLRAWEKRYGAIQPGRTPTGRRIYSFADVERLKLLARLVARGHSIGTVAGLAQARLARLAEAEDGSAERAETAAAAANDAEAQAGADRPAEGRAQPWVARVLRLLERFELDALSATLTRARLDLRARDFALEVIVPVLAEVGLRVDAGTLSVAQEHALSQVIRAELDRIHVPNPPRFAPGAPIFVEGTPEGDRHEFGALISGCLVSLAGFPDHYLGCSLPAADLAAAARKLGASVVILGMTASRSGPGSADYRRYVRSLIRLLPRDVSLWVGGSAASSMLDLSKEDSRRVRHLATLGELERALQERGSRR